MKSFILDLLHLHDQQVAYDVEKFWHMSSGHKFHKCDKDDCTVCNGGLKSCDVCLGGEGALTTQCPGRAMTEQEIVDVYEQRIDFCNGQWVKPVVSTARDV